MTGERRCERCGEPIGAERLAERPEATRCLDCQAHAARMQRPGIDDLREQRDGLPEALRRPEQLWESD
jgi:RNA polymerase-binding transcription factor DksA